LKKISLLLFLFVGINFSYADDTRRVIIGPDGRLQYYPRFSSMTIGDLGSGIKILDEGVLQGGATWFNFVGAGVVATVNGGTATVTVNGGGGSQTQFYPDYAVTNAINTNVKGTSPYKSQRLHVQKNVYVLNLWTNPQ
jgi:hypothetical protein